MTEDSGRTSPKEDPAGRGRPAKEEHTILLTECTDDILEQLAGRVNAALGRRFSIFALRSVDYYRYLAGELTASGRQGRVVFDAKGPYYLQTGITEAFPPMMARVIDREAFLDMAACVEEDRFQWPVEPESLGERNPFRHCMLCEEV